MRSKKAMTVSVHLFQYSYDIITIPDKTGSFTYETPSVQRIFEYESGYLIGKTPRDFIHADNIDQVVDILNEVYSETNTGTPTEFRFRKADGSWVYIGDRPGRVTISTGICQCDEKYLMQSRLRQEPEAILKNSERNSKTCSRTETFICL